MTEQPDDIAPILLAGFAEFGQAAAALPPERRNDGDTGPGPASPGQLVLGAWSLAGLVATLGLAITLLR